MDGFWVRVTPLVRRSTGRRHQLQHRLIPVHASAKRQWRHPTLDPRPIRPIPTSRVPSHAAIAHPTGASHEKTRESSCAGRSAGRCAGWWKHILTIARRPSGPTQGGLESTWNDSPTPSARSPSSSASRARRPTTSSPRACCRSFLCPAGASSSPERSSSASSTRPSAGPNPPTETSTRTGTAKPEPHTPLADGDRESPPSADRSADIAGSVCARGRSRALWHVVLRDLIRR
jgi:hypothetical protein